MKLLNGHLNITPKSVTAGIAAVTGIFIAFEVFTPVQATAVGALLSFVASLVVPSRDDTGK